MGSILTDQVAKLRSKAGRIKRAVMDDSGIFLPGYQVRKIELS